MTPELPPESQRFELSSRAVSLDLKSIRVFTGRSSFELESQVSFDPGQPTVSATEYLLGSLAGSMMLAIIEEARRADFKVDELEARVTASVENPLTLVGVRGCEEPPRLRDVVVTLYVEADHSEAELSAFCLGALERCVLYQSLREALGISVNFRFTMLGDTC